MRRTTSYCLGLVLLHSALVSLHPVTAQEPRPEPSIESVSLGGGIFALVGRGGNIGVSAGVDGAMLIDDQFASEVPAILSRVRALTDRPVRFVLNTHWHGDHTGGNESLGKAGAVVVAHENVRTRMSVDQFNELFDRTTPASPEGALPIVIFNDTVTFHLNGEEIHAFHVPTAHTDGDTIVHFRKANVVHTGDVFFNGIYPFIDVTSGGSIDGTIAAVRAALALCGESTKIIPGHGPVTDRTGLEEYLRMLSGVRDRVQEAIDQGLSRDEATAGELSAPFDEKWGGGYFTPDQFVGFVYDSLKRR